METWACVKPMAHDASTEAFFYAAIFLFFILDTPNNFIY